MPHPLRRRLLILPSTGKSYLFRDEFTTDRAAGAVNGTAAEPGPGTRGGTDTESKVLIANERLSFGGGKASPTWGDPVVTFNPISRSPGVLFLAEITSSTTNHYKQFGLSSGSLSGASLLRSGVYLFNDGTVRETNTILPLGSYISATSYRFFIALRTSGHVTIMSQGALNLLIFVASVGSESPLTPFTMAYNGAYSQDYIRIPADTWLPAPVVSDGFGSTFGTSDGLGHAEGIAGGIGSGGGNAAWTQQIGTWGISSGKAVATALSGGEAVATVPLSTANPFIGIDLARGVGNVGGVARWTDANNHLRFHHDGTNCVLQQVVSGTPTTLITAAATYSANARAWLWLNGTTARLYYNNALIGSTSSINAALTAANVGIRTTDTGNTADNFVAYAVGAEGQYGNLNQY